MRAQSNIHSSISGRNLKSFSKAFDAKNYKDLEKIGIHFKSDALKVAAKFAMDTYTAPQATVSTASINVPIQFLQAWLPGFVYVLTAARKIDDILGIMTIGSWEDEEVVQGLLERTGYSLPYSDVANVPYSSWNTNFERRTIVRFEQGMTVGLLEAARASKMNLSVDAAKRQAAALSLEIVRNLTGFYGYNSGLNRTYGFLNDPNLPAYVNVPNGASGSPLWLNKTFLEICKDIRSTLVSLRTNSQDTIDPETTPITMAVATDAVDYLSTTSDFGISVRDWLRKAYPNVRVTSAPQLNLANGGANVFYMFAERVTDESTDDGKTFIQMVPSKFMMLGVQQLPKAYVEDYSNASAGVMCKRPFAVVRRSGI